MVKNYQRYHQLWREGGELLHVIGEGHEHDREEDCPSDPFGFIRGVSDSWRLEEVDDPRLVSEADALNSPICSSVANGTLCCDRSSIRSDVCKLKGDIRTDSGSSSIFLYTNTEFSDYVPSISDDGHGNEILQHEKIRPYTRKWETNMMMEKVSELDLIVKKGNSTSNTKNQHHKCDVNHEVPAVFFSTGGYTGNVYHDINDGILPLYITSQHFNRKVVFVILDYHEWWLTKYGDVLSRLSDYPVIDFGADKRTHCFPEAIVGLKIHDELAIDPSLIEDNKTMVDFRNVLDRAYWPRIRGLMRAEEKEGKLMLKKSKPSLAIISRKGSREITNENALVKMAEEIGFSVTVLRPEKTTELAKMYRVLNSSDVMIGVHGAAMTYFLFMKPDSIFIQIIPLGLDWPSENYYGEPSRRLGLKYTGYKILPKESSLYTKYGKNDPVLTDPDSATGKRWELTKQIYLDHQNVRLNLPRFRKRLVRAYDYTLHHAEKALAI
ncbi:OLC1v1036760C1 [Oldenlandia corymbosa var. corymbosa]|uniref:OLC1v1036760C1 n=1 Tax=Oldenlandia corymbosa var. corymbosa TaxID=529605 RepID=A0AAV1CWQ9_OLDCO|nr:OLC1v1036760C1 [Oldenlandia corymbosa var. corymbosa]